MALYTKKSLEEIRSQLAEEDARTTKAVRKTDRPYFMRRNRVDTTSPLGVSDPVEELMAEFSSRSATIVRQTSAIANAKSKNRQLKEEITDLSPTAEAGDQIFVKGEKGKQPLTIRNNNPGNLRFAGQDGAEKGEGGFARFKTAEAGMLAMRKQIVLDTQTRGQTLREFINKYAPPSENETTKYLKTVSNTIGIDPDQKVPENLINDLQKIMIQLEGGKVSLDYFMREDEE
jgi:hypothetical protein|tara:strand:- start:528 stop:1220 length:693 start_codon:yes stop_codon:yes gene_type:complete